MADLDLADGGIPRLFYKETCPPCQWMSKLVVLLSFGVIRRVAIGSAEAKSLYARYPEHEGQLLLIEGRRFTAGRMVFAAVPATLARAGLRRVFRGDR